MLFPPSPQCLEPSATFSAWFLGSHCREFGEWRKRLFCVCGAWGLVPGTDSCPIRATRPALPVALTLFLKPQTSLQTLIMHFWVEKSTGTLCVQSLAGSSAFLTCIYFHHNTWVSFEITGIVHLLIHTSRLWSPWSQRSSEHISLTEHLFSARLPPSGCSTNICLVVHWAKV